MSEKRALTAHYVQTPFSSLFIILSDIAEVSQLSNVTNMSRSRHSLVNFVVAIIYILIRALGNTSTKEETGKTDMESCNQLIWKF